MSDQHEQQDDVSGHVYIPTDERAGSRSDTEGHMSRVRLVDTADEGDVDDDVEGHQVAPGDPINEPPGIRGRGGRGQR